MKLAHHFASTMLLACSTLFVANPAANAGKHHRHRKAPCCSTCGQEVCVGKSEIEEIELPTFDCETESVCIPAVRFPWQCGPPKCGWVRKVAVMTESKMKMEKCVWSWSVKDLCEECQQPLPVEIPSAEPPQVEEGTTEIEAAVPPAPPAPSVDQSARNLAVPPVMPASFRSIPTQNVAPAPAKLVDSLSSRKLRR